MKKLILTLPLVLLLCARCANDFEVAAPWKEIPVVYGILSPQDTAVYIRVEKAFLDQEDDGLTLAKRPDSLYYPENAISVFLQRVSTGVRAQLQRVDGALEGYVRNDGIFATSPNYLYKLFPSQLGGLQPGETYRLVVERADGKPPVTAQTTIPKEFTLTTPNPQSLPLRLGFTNVGSDTKIAWRSDVNALYFDLTFTIRYRDVGLDGTPLGSKSLTWVALRDVRRTDQLVGADRYIGSASIPGVNFFDFLAANIPPLNDRIRFFESVDLLLDGGGKELEEFRDILNANSGITGAEVIPFSTNISEGRGLFIAKSRTVFPNLLITTLTVDAMNDYQPTKLLNFRY